MTSCWHWHKVGEVKPLFKELEEWPTLGKKSFKKWIYICMGIPGGSVVKNLLQCGRHRRRGFHPWVGKIPWRRAWQPTPVFLPEESHGQRSLAGYSLWCHKESDMTEINTFTFREENPAGKDYLLPKGFPLSRIMCLWIHDALTAFLYLPLVGFVCLFVLI